MPKFSVYYRIDVGVRTQPIEAETAEQAEKIAMASINFDMHLGLNRSSGFRNPLIKHTQYGDHISATCIDCLDDDGSHIENEHYPIVIEHDVTTQPG